MVCCLHGWLVLFLPRVAYRLNLKYKALTRGNHCRFVGIFRILNRIFEILHSHNVSSENSSERNNLDISVSSSCGIQLMISETRQTSLIIRT